jgi:hypothetical protein
VPGNHDLVRPDPEDPTVVLLGDWTGKPNVRDAFWKPGSRYQGLIRAAFAPYQAFWDRAAHRPAAGVVAGLLPGDFSYVYEKAGARFGFLGLNSAFLQLTGANFEGQLAVDPRQAQAAVGGDLDRWASSCHAAFLLTHHPPSWLCPEARGLLDEELVTPGRFTAHLFGHMHEARARTLAEGFDAPRREWQGTSLFGLEWIGDPNKRERERRHGYTAGRITLDGDTASIRQWPRRADRGQSRARHLSPDTSYRLDNDVANVDDSTPPSWSLGRRTSGPCGGWTLPIPMLRSGSPTRWCSGGRPSACLTVGHRFDSTRWAAGPETPACWSGVFGVALGGSRKVRSDERDRG